MTYTHVDSHMTFLVRVALSLVPGGTSSHQIRWPWEVDPERA